MRRDPSYCVGSPLTLLLLDLDHFKQINDCYGHAMDDFLLRGGGDILCTRTVDRAARYGGEELCMLQPGIHLQGVLTLAES